jgi:hypothetical protein
MKNYEIIVGLYGYSERIEKNDEKYETFCSQNPVGQ